MLNIKKTNKYSIITVLNWSKYQNDEQELNNSCTSNEHQMFTYKNVKNDNNEKKYINSRGFTPPTLEEVAQYCNERNNNIDPNRFIDFYQSKNWMVGKNKMKDWKAAVRNWESRDKKSNTPSQKQTQGRTEPKWYQDQKNGVEEEFKQATPEEIEEVNRMLKELYG